MKCPAQVQYAGTELRVYAAGLVVAALPVECHLEGVLHGEGTPVNEEQVRQRRIAQHPREGLHKAGHRHRVHVGVARFVQRGLGEFGAKLVVVGQRGVVHAQRRRCEEREHIQVAPAVARIDEIRTRRAVQIEHQVEAVGQDAAREHLMDLVGFEEPIGERNRCQGGGHAVQHSRIFTEF